MVERFSHLLCRKLVVAAKSDGIIKLSAGINEGVEIKNGGVVCSISSAGISGGDPRADARTQVTAAKQNLERTEIVQFKFGYSERTSRSAGRC